MRAEIFAYIESQIWSILGSGSYDSFISYYCGTTLNFLIAISGYQ